MDGWGDLRATKWQNARAVGGSDNSVSDGNSQTSDTH
jgi:hypothetical protein